MACQRTQASNLRNNNQTKPNQRQMTTKQIESVSLVLNHKNWTGVTLRDLIDLGRVYQKDRATITAFVREVHGEPTSIDQLTKQRGIVNAIMERGVA